MNCHIEQFFSLHFLTRHDVLRDGVDLAVHEELPVLRDLHDDHPEVGPAQVQGEELADLVAVGKSPA